MIACDLPWNRWQGRRGHVGHGCGVLCFPGMSADRNLCTSKADLGRGGVAEPRRRLSSSVGRGITWFLLPSFFMLGACSVARAQRVMGSGDDAFVLPRGVLRIRTSASWSWYNERFGDGTPGHPSGQ